MMMMRACLVPTLLLGMIGSTAVLPNDPPPAKETPDMTTKTVFDFTVKDIDGKDVALSTYEGDVLLIVNVASQ